MLLLSSVGTKNPSRKIAARYAIPFGSNTKQKRRAIKTDGRPSGSKKPDVMVWLDAEFCWSKSQAKCSQKKAFKGACSAQCGRMENRRPSDGKRVQQFVRHIEGGALVMFGVSVGAAVTLLVSSFPGWCILLTLLGGIVLSGVAVINHTKDQIETRARAFDQEFKSVHMRDKRRKAAKYWLQKEGKREDINEVLDFFHDVGRAFKHGEIDGRTAWHNFYEWLQGYWETECAYIIEQRDKYGAWGSIFPLYQALKQIDGGKNLTTSETTKFWETEQII